MKKKIQKVYEDNGFGFPVTLLNVPMTTIRGEWVPDINQKQLQEKVLEALVFKPGKLTGNEIRFIRLFCDMTLQEFADRFDLTHPGVLKWENSKNHVTEMKWPTEKDIRLMALTKIRKNSKNFFAAYEELEKKMSKVQRPIKIDLEKKSA